MARRALIVGINTYGGGNDLDACVADAKAMAEVLSRHKDNEKNFDCLLLLDRMADGSQITRPKLAAPARPACRFIPGSRATSKPATARSGNVGEIEHLDGGASSPSAGRRPALGAGRQALERVVDFRGRDARPDLRQAVVQPLEAQVDQPEERLVARRGIASRSRPAPA